MVWDSESAALQVLIPLVPTTLSQTLARNGSNEGLMRDVISGSRTTEIRLGMGSSPKKTSYGTAEHGHEWTSRTRTRTLLGAPGRTSRSKDASSNKGHRY